MKRRKQNNDSKLPIVIGIDQYNEDASKRYFAAMQRGECPSRLSYFFFGSNGDPIRRGYVLVHNNGAKWFLRRMDADAALDRLNKGERI